MNCTMMVKSLNLSSNSVPATFMLLKEVTPLFLEVTPLFLSVLSYKMGVIMCLLHCWQIKHLVASTQIFADVYWTVWSVHRVYMKSR